MLRTLICLAAVSLALSAGVAQADLLWNNMADFWEASRSAACTDAPDGYWGGAWYAEVADDFTVPDGPGWRLTEFHMIYHYFVSPPGDWLWLKFYEDNGQNMPADEPFKVLYYEQGEFEEVYTGYNWGGNWPQWEGIIPLDLSLPPGHYFVSGIPGVADQDYSYSPNATPDPRSESTAYLRSLEDGRPYPDQWTSAYDFYGDTKYEHFAFQLQGEVIPEPGAAFALGTVLLGVWAVRKKRV